MSALIPFLRQFEERANQAEHAPDFERLMGEAWENYQEHRSEEHLETLQSQGYTPWPGEVLPTWAGLPEEPDWAAKLLSQFGSYYLNRDKWRWEVLAWMCLPLAYNEGEIAFFTLLALLVFYHRYRTAEERALKEIYGSDWLKAMESFTDKILDSTP